MCIYDKYLSEFFLEQEMFLKTVVEKLEKKTFYAH